jgi:transposase
VEAVRLAKERVERLERLIAELVPTWSLAPVVTALQAPRGANLVVAVTSVAEIGDLRRFESPRRLVDGLPRPGAGRASAPPATPSGAAASPSGCARSPRRDVGAADRAGDGRVRHLLVESAWTYRHPPRVGKAKLAQLARVPAKVREIAWEAQGRLTARYRALAARGKRPTIVRTAIARELAGFMWSIARERQPA